MLRFLRRLFRRPTTNAVTRESKRLAAVFERMDAERAKGSRT